VPVTCSYGLMILATLAWLLQCGSKYRVEIEAIENPVCRQS